MEEAQKHLFYFRLHSRRISENTSLTTAEKDKKYSGKYRLAEWLECYADERPWAVKLVNEWKEVPNKSEVMAREYPLSKEWFKQWEEHWENKANELDAYIADICKAMNFPKFAHIWLNNGLTIYVNYQLAGGRAQLNVLEALFDDYNSKIDQINQKLPAATLEEIQQLQDQKIEAICFLYQMLEWLHPYQDGQGRTDLVLMAKLLSEEGETPAILNSPYLSTYASLQDWKAYLIQGMNAWRKEAGLI